MLLTVFFNKELIQAGAELEALDNDGDTPLSYTLRRKHRDCAERLLDAGAKVSNVEEDIDIPDWVGEVIIKRKNVVASLRVFIGLMRKRYNVEGQHIGNRLPRDLVKLISKHLWSTRFDERWSKTVSSPKKLKI